MKEAMRLDLEQQRRLNGWLGDIEQGRLTAGRERQLRGLLARIDSGSLTMDLSELYDFACLTAGYMHLLDVAEGRARA